MKGFVAQDLHHWDDKSHSTSLHPFEGTPLKQQKIELKEKTILAKKRRNNKI